jgi:hypothetical protein
VAQIFSEWTNKVPLYIVLALALVAPAAALGVWYFFSPEYTDVGYQPEQPIAYSHAQHVGELGLDCRYCHVNVERAAVASVPPTSVCMNCHRLVGRDLESLEPLRQSAETQQPIRWVRVHKVPDYAYFDHGVHVRAGVGCSTCHGDVAQMVEVRQVEPLSMGWCLECHRNPAPYIRPQDQITNTSWRPPEDQLEVAQALLAERGIEMTTRTRSDCSTCHR